jgi:hypothetical protein
VRRPSFRPWPPAGATRLETLIFLRRNYLLAVAILAVLALVSVIVFSLVTLIVCSVLFVLQIAGLASLERQIRSTRDRLD